LEPVYPFVFMDCAIHYKVREDRRYVTKAAYVVLGVTMDGRKRHPGSLDRRKLRKTANSG
ncbi:MAG: transposase, partial [Dysosmobacter sp.]